MFHLLLRNPKSAWTCHCVWQIDIHRTIYRYMLYSTFEGGIFWGHFLPQQSGCGKKKVQKWSSAAKDGAHQLDFSQRLEDEVTLHPLNITRVTGWKMRTTTPRNLTNIPKMPLFWRDLPFSKLPSLGIYLKRPKVYSISGTCKIVIPRGCFSKTSFWGSMVHFPA